MNRIMLVDFPDRPRTSVSEALTHLSSGVTLVIDTRPEPPSFDELNMPKLIAPDLGSKHRGKHRGRQNGAFGSPIG